MNIINTSQVIEKPEVKQSLIREILLVNVPNMVMAVFSLLMSVMNVAYIG